MTGYVRVYDYDTEATPMSTETDIVESFPKTNPAIEQEDIVALRSWGHRAIAEITKLRAERDAAARDMRERCLVAVENLRVRDATNFKDAHCQGQRGVDRTDAFYDAYHTIRTLPAIIATEGNNG